MENKKTWGGKREGAGRKKGCAKRYMFSATPDVVEILDSLTTNKSEFICAAIRKAALNK